MSYLRWKKETATRKSVTIYPSPYTAFILLLFFAPLVMTFIRWLRSLAE